MKIAKMLISLLLALAMLLSLCACSDSADGEEDSNIVYMVVENYGVIKIQLYAEQAPITVANFKKLVKEGFYDGLTFHRIIESFMIQGGCPEGTGRGGADEDIKGEFANNGVNTGLKHVAGTISMARSGHPYESYHDAGYINLPYEQRQPYYNSASSQFFIVTETNDTNTASLDGKYAAFGQVLEGMDVVKAIAAVQTGENNRPLTPVVIKTVTFDKKVAYAK